MGGKLRPHGAAPPPLLGLLQGKEMTLEQVGTYKLSPDLKKKAEAHRQKKDKDEEEARKKRLEALAARKQDKAVEERVWCVCVCVCVCVCGWELHVKEMRNEIKESKG